MKINKLFNRDVVWMITLSGNRKYWDFNKILKEEECYKYRVLYKTGNDICNVNTIIIQVTKRTMKKMIKKLRLLNHEIKYKKQATTFVTLIL